MSQGNAVVLSEKAGAILQGFPESWVFAGSSKRARWEQIGQAVPIAVAEAVARRVLVQLGSK
jgi:site-specific DNA-cytosine methylase